MNGDGEQRTVVKGIQRREVLRTYLELRMRVTLAVEVVNETTGQWVTAHETDRGEAETLDKAVTQWPRGKEDRYQEERLDALRAALETLTEEAPEALETLLEDPRVKAALELEEDGHE